MPEARAPRLGPASGNLSRSSSTMRSAVFLPIPGMRVSRATSFPRIAPTISSAAMPLRIVIASFGPIPLTVISFSNSSFSDGTQKSVERNQIFAHVRMNVQRNLGADRRKLGERRAR